MLLLCIGFRGRGPYSTQGQGFPKKFGPNNSRVLWKPSQRPTCQICHKFSHYAERCYNRFDTEFEASELPQAMAAMRVSDKPPSPGHEWYPDTGASVHITNSAQNLYTSQDYQGYDVVVVDGNYLPITHIGSMPLHTISGSDTRKKT